MRRLEDKEIMKHYQKCETYIGAKTTETLIDNILSFFTKALGMLARITDINALKNELKNDNIVTKELSNLSSSLALRCSRLLAVANSFWITAKHVHFSSEVRWPIRAKHNSIQERYYGLQMSNIPRAGVPYLPVQ